MMVREEVKRRREKVRERSERNESRAVAGGNKR